MARTTFAHTTHGWGRARLGQCVLLLLLLHDMRRICLSADKHASYPAPLPHSHLPASAAHAKRTTSTQEVQAGREAGHTKIFQLSARGVEINKHPGQKCVVIKANLIALSIHRYRYNPAQPQSTSLRCST